MGQLAWGVQQGTTQEAVSRKGGALFLCFHCLLGSSELLLDLNFHTELNLHRTSSRIFWSTSFLSCPPSLQTPSLSLFEHRQTQLRQLCSPSGFRGSTPPGRSWMRLLPRGIRQDILGGGVHFCLRWVDIRLVCPWSPFLEAWLVSEQANLQVPCSLC